VVSATNVMPINTSGYRMRVQSLDKIDFTQRFSGLQAASGQLATANASWMQATIHAFVYTVYMVSGVKNSWRCHAVDDWTFGQILFRTGSVDRRGWAAYGLVNWTNRRLPHNECHMFNRYYSELFAPRSFTVYICM
jgi:hypothetical protein